MKWVAWYDYWKTKASPLHKSIETDAWYLNIVLEESYTTTHSSSKKTDIKGLPKPLNIQPKFVKKGNNLWGLKDPTWNLNVVACDYYILLLANIFNSKKYAPYLEHRANLLVDQFSRYTDMAVGGELRHAKAKTSVYPEWKDNVPLPLLTALWDTTLGGSRNSAWEGWYHFRKRHGTLALIWAVATFGLKGWGGGYGGKRWKNIANTLLMYEQGLTTKHTFIDTCFGLQHNGGIYFNKWWGTENIQQTLDANQRGDYCEVKQNASQIVKTLIEIDIDEMLKEACLCPSHNTGTN